MSVRREKGEHDLRLYLDAILRVEEGERRQIAHRLRNDIAQSVLALAQRLDLVISGRPPRLSQSVKENLENMRSLATSIYEGLSSCAQDLSLSILEDLGLVAALEWLCDELKKDQGIETEVRVINDTKILSWNLQVILFRVVRAALSNIRMHAHASNANIVLEIRRDQVEMVVTDNGKGFQPPSELTSLVRREKLGLAIIEGLVRSAGGTLRIKSVAGEGTRVTIELPLDSS